jgi:phosphoglycolate phosphatase-like HAD superfamily hydrolase
MTIRGILFDNDGTLVDTHDLILASMRHGTRTVLGRVIPDEKLMAKVGIPLAEQMLDFKPRFSNKDALVRNYEWYCAHLSEFAGKTGVSHRVPWKQGLLACAKWFF